jgi:tRNA dimethylallyltransferase
MALPPLITICGTTGVGKSKLAIELALQLFKTQYNGWKGARIINADAMQVYRGLDILTNKVPVTEQQGIEHLLMGFKNPGEQYVVGQWIQDAVSIVSCTLTKTSEALMIVRTCIYLGKGDPSKEAGTHYCWRDVILDSTPPLPKSTSVFGS